VPKGFSCSAKNPGRHAGEEEQAGAKAPRGVRRNLARSAYIDFAADAFSAKPFR
jgi:hypothetical protein